jgi:hypothetical protein
MLNMLSPTLPAPAASEIQQALNLIASLADPVASKKRLTELAAAQKSAQEWIEKAKDAPREFEKLEAEHTAKLSKAAAVHDREINAREAAFNIRCGEREAALQSAEARSADHERQTKRANDEAEKLRVDLQTRINHLRRGVASDPLLETKLFEQGNGAAR